MTHQEGIGSAFADLNALLIDLGPAAIAEVFATLMNHAMQIVSAHHRHSLAASVGPERAHEMSRRTRPTGGQRGDWPASPT